jgi:predicted metal-dependent peptidase
MTVSKYPEIERKIRLALAIILNGAPFDASILMSMKIKEDESIPTAMTDCATYLHYSPKWFGNLCPESIAAVLAHEAAHKWLMHGFRRGNRDAKVFNIAADFVLNAELARRGFIFGPDLGPRCTVHQLKRAWEDPTNNQNLGFAYDTSLDTAATTEGVYDLLMQSMPPPEGGGGGKNGQGTFDQMLEPDPDANPEATEQAVALDIMQAAATAKARGALSANVQRIVGELESPVEDWRKLTKRFLNRARDMRRTNDTGYHRPSRRAQHGSCVVLPARRYEPYGDWVIGIDTSGSITDEDLKVYELNTQAFVQQIRPKRIYVVYCDTKVNHVDIFNDGEPVKFNSHGGGGTTFVPVFDWVQDEKLKPLALIYFTDADGTFPRKPGYPTLWAVKGRSSVPWGVRVQLPD